MFKGTPLNMRDQGWHIKHMAKLKRRKEIRQLHIDQNRSYMTAQKEEQRKFDKLSEGAEKGKKDWNWFQRFIMAIWFRLTNPFRELLRTIKYKYGNVQA